MTVVKIIFVFIFMLFKIPGSSASPHIFRYIEFPIPGYKIQSMCWTPVNGDFQSSGTLCLALSDNPKDLDLPRVLSCIWYLREISEVVWHLSKFHQHLCFSNKIPFLQWDPSPWVQVSVMSTSCWSLLPVQWRPVGHSVTFRSWFNGPNVNTS